MGQTGSFTAKVNMRPTLLPYTKWGAPQLQAVLLRSRHELADTFALRSQEFVFLLGRRDIDVAGALDVFKNVFDTDSNKLVDKLEVMCVLCLASTLSSELKVEMLYDIFDFDNKGYLSEVELLLLFKVVTTASTKVDREIALPSTEGLAQLLADAWHFSERGSETLRKYELVSFASNSPEVRSYMEVWRGHASQVFVVKGQKWQDGTFPAVHTSIAPSKEWLSIGLPPASFVRWLRRPRLKPACETLFGHSEKYAKAVNKMVLDGFGAVANGTIVQGLLASSWMINAVSMLIHRPKTLMSLFPTTAQEFLGRFCVRLYEGGRWNSVFIDDRIPCTADGVPIFTQTSFSQECWMMLLEKALAKHLGSYGHVAVAAKRADAVEGALRMLTGGHVTKLYVPDFDWKSVSDEVHGEDGMEMVVKLLSEGSLISFGRSEPLLLNRGTLAQFPATALPHGRVFSVVGIEEISRHKYLVLRDPWGLQSVRSEANGEADYGSCHCRTFLMKAEDVLSTYDTAFVVRFPDALRSLDTVSYTPWITRVRWCPSNGLRNPAMFKLTVPKSDSDDLDADEEADEAQGAVAEPVIVEDVPLSDDEDRDQAVGLEASEAAALVKKKKRVPTPVECCITVNSSVEWAKSTPSEKESDLPTIVIRVVPCEKTLDDLKSRNRDIQSVNKLRYANDYNLRKREHKTSSSVAPLAVVSEFELLGEAGAEAETTAGGAKESERGSIRSVNVEQSPPSAIVDNPFEFTVRARRNWKSMTLFLWPGEYHIISSVEYAAVVNPEDSVESKVRDSFVKSKEKTLWRIPAEGDHRIWAQVSSLDNLRLFPMGPETGSGPEELEDIAADFVSTENRLAAENCSHWEKEMWPFFIEHQLDTGTIGLTKILYRLRRETSLAATELLSLRIKHEDAFAKLQGSNNELK